MPQVVLRLRPQPGFGATAEPLCEADRHVGADGRAAIDDPRQRHPGYAKLIRCLGDGQAKIGQHVFTDNQARCGGLNIFIVISSVVVLIVNKFGIFASEPECQAPVAVNPNRPASCITAAQSVQFPTRLVHFVGILGDIQYCQLPRKFVSVRRLDSSFAASQEKLLQSLVGKTFNHRKLYRITTHLSTRAWTGD